MDATARPALPLGCALALLAQAGVAAAAPPPGGGWAVSPVGQYQYTLAPGAAAAGAIDLINSQSRDQTLTLYSADMQAIPGGGFSPAPPGATTGVGAWMDLGETAVTVPPRSAARVPFTLTVPAGAAPGQYDGAIVAAAPAVPGSGGMGVSTRTALAVQVAVPLAVGEVSAGGGADLASPGGAWRVAVPPGAVPPGASLTLSPASGGPVPVFPALPRGAELIAGPVALRAAGADGAPQPDPAEPVVVTAEVPAGVSGARLFLLEFDPGLHAWLPLPTDVGGGVARARADRLDGLALAADPEIGVYPDVAGGWEEGAVLALQALGDVSGYPDGTFRPAATMTRAEFALLLQRALHLPPGAASGLSAFPDAAAVPPWAAPAVAATAAAGLLQGDAAGIDPAGGLSRAEAAVIAARALDLPGGPATGFTDAGSIPPWAAAGVGAAAAAGLIDGYPGGAFRPLQPVTRAEAAALVLRLLRLRGA